MITRIAPTPSGYLHEGNLYNFLLNWLWARANGGQVWLRIDDADVQRKRPEYVEDIFKVLEWMGLDWDIGPTGPDDLEKNWSQIHRRPSYKKLLTTLAEKKQLYACVCSRTQMKTADPTCNCYEPSLSLESEDAAWKIKIGTDTTVSIPHEKNQLLQQSIPIHDFIVRKKDGWPSYAITSLADDMEMGVTHIARGVDLLESTARQIHIAQQLSNQAFSSVQFWHHELLLNETAEKISKSAGYQSKSIIHTTTPNLIIARFKQWMHLDDYTHSSLQALQDASIFKLS